MGWEWRETGLLVIKRIDEFKILALTLKLSSSSKTYVGAFHPFFKKKNLHIADERVELNCTQFLSASKIHWILMTVFINSSLLFLFLLSLTGPCLQHPYGIVSWEATTPQQRSKETVCEKQCLVRFWVPDPRRLFTTLHSSVAIAMCILALVQPLPMLPI